MYLIKYKVARKYVFDLIEFYEKNNFIGIKNFTKNYISKLEDENSFNPKLIEKILKKTYPEKYGLLKKLKVMKILNKY
jgi:hypothetical protein